MPSRPVSYPPPITIPALGPPTDPSRSARFIFINGLGDDASGLETNTPAWYTPTSLTSSHPELDDDEDNEGIKTSTIYVVSLIDGLISQGIPLNRIIIGGFSQGCAMSLIVGLTSKYAGKLGGIVSLSDYLPLADKISALREEAELTPHVDNKVPMFLARGTRDMMIPKRYCRIAYETLFGLGVKREVARIKEYEGMGHVMSGAVLRDLCAWLEEVVGVDKGS
ncbi:alpha/beta-hydrolase [Amniculicola lignicola CBS 123094]|uniref:Acyl-protein thioesterase 1 n=1 Tax=Amniculicola lignicola CBS 123094 TaxID=1392246 RepID=A0A6A5WEL5_9PLEO|nr:alpha/beta-hydrolase [Amniculicola lignicola CBS 123094]